MERRRAQLEESVARYLSQLDTADRQEPTEALAAKVTRLNEKLTKLKEEMGIEVVERGEDLTHRPKALEPVEEIGVWHVRPPLVPVRTTDLL